MIQRNIRNSFVYNNSFNINKYRSATIHGLLEARKLYNVETLKYNLLAVCATDIDPTGNFLLVGLCNGTVDLQGVENPAIGTLEQIYSFNFGQFVNGLHRVQWNPGDEQFFSILDNNNLYLIDPLHYRTIDTFPFSIKTVWSEWNPNERKMIAVCGNESQTRLVDIRSGSSVQTIILGAKSGLASHRSTRCLWSKHDTNCLIVGDNEGYIHIYDTRHSVKPLLWAGDAELGGQISGMSFKSDNYSIITTQGTENKIVEWNYDKCKLIPNPHKYKKRKLQEAEVVPVSDASCSKTKIEHNTKAETSKSISASNKSNKRSRKETNTGVIIKKPKKRTISLPVDALLRCQFYVTDKHIFCPVPMGTTKSKEVYVYDIDTGDRIKTIKSDDILTGGVYSITGLLPESLVLYVGGRGRLRVWTIDEDYERKLEEKMNKYHVTIWDSDDE